VKVRGWHSLMLTRWERRRRMVRDLPMQKQSRWLMPKLNQKHSHSPTPTLKRLLILKHWETGSVRLMLMQIGKPMRSTIVRQMVTVRH